MGSSSSSNDNSVNQGECIPPPWEQHAANEWTAYYAERDTIELDCPENTQLKLISATYSTCNADPPQTSDCMNDLSFRIAPGARIFHSGVELSRGRGWVIKHVNEICNDHAVGEEKMLKLRYQCDPADHSQHPANGKTCRNDMDCKWTGFADTLVCANDHYNHARNKCIHPDHILPERTRAYCKTVKCDDEFDLCESNPTTCQVDLDLTNRIHQSSRGYVQHHRKKDAQENCCQAKKNECYADCDAVYNQAIANI